jgi:crotonobetainyl-CoA:carnitine CoA-transferase CaiB-like acyl-CoA transferase
MTAARTAPIPLGTPSPDPVPDPLPDPAPGPLAGLRILDLADEKGQFCGKLLGDLGADVVKIEPPGGQATRRVGPFLDDLYHPERSLSFWHYNTSKRGITLNLQTADGRQLFRRLAARADVIVETFRPDFLPSLGLDYDSLCAMHAGLIMCSLTPFGQTGPWRNYATGDVLHMAAGGQMASCGYDEADVPNAPPIAPGGGNAWHMGCHFAFMAIMAALVYRTGAGEGQYIDASIHEACALTTEAAIANYIYRGETMERQTGRHHAPAPTPRTQFRSKDGTYVTALVAGRLTPRYVKDLAALLDTYGMAGDLNDPKYQDPAVIAASTSHIIDNLVANFIASLPAEEVYHAAQARGFTWGAVRAPEALLDDAHLNDRDFWKRVDHAELNRSFLYPGEAAIYSGSPWRISRRAPLIGEHNAAIFCDELGLSRGELAALAENRVI